MAGLDLSGRTIVVTGPAKGMGRRITLTLAESGADLVLAGRDTAAIDAVADEARALGREVLVVRTDVTDAAEMEHAAAAAAERFPGLWGAVAVAGVSGPSGRKLWEHTVEDFRELFEVNVMGVFLLLRAMLPRLMARQGGSVVVIGGTFGFKGARDASLYGSTKWALRGLVKSAALEAGAAGVRVNMVSPGGVEGPRLSRQFAEQADREGVTPEEIHARFARGTALGRTSEDSDVAASVLFLLSAAARNITGQDLLVDGGTIV